MVLLARVQAELGRLEGARQTKQLNLAAGQRLVNCRCRESGEKSDYNCDHGDHKSVHGAESHDLVGQVVLCADLVHRRDIKSANR
eukprot:3849032-Prymnesium_polylepis.1